MLDGLVSTHCFDASFVPFGKTAVFVTFFKCVLQQHIKDAYEQLLHLLFE